MLCDRSNWVNSMIALWESIYSTISRKEILLLLLSLTFSKLRIFSATHLSAARLTTRRASMIFLVSEILVREISLLYVTISSYSWSCNLGLTQEEFYLTKPKSHNINFTQQSAEQVISTDWNQTLCCLTNCEDERLQFFTVARCRDVEIGQLCRCIRC